MDTLRKHLIKHDGGCGRAGKELQRIAKKAKVSVHMVQSVAMGRRRFGDATQKRVQRILDKAK